MGAEAKRRRFARLQKPKRFGRMQAGSRVRTGQPWGGRAAGVDAALGAQDQGQPGGGRPLMGPAPAETPWVWLWGALRCENVFWESSRSSRLLLSGNVTVRVSRQYPLYDLKITGDSLGNQIAASHDEVQRT